MDPEETVSNNLAGEVDDGVFEYVLTPPPSPTPPHLLPAFLPDPGSGCDENGGPIRRPTMPCRARQPYFQYYESQR